MKSAKDVLNNFSNTCSSWSFVSARCCILGNEFSDAGNFRSSRIGVVRWPMGPCLTQILAYLVILCFERRCPKQKNVACLNSNFSPPNFSPTPKFSAGCATVFTRTVFGPRGQVSHPSSVGPTRCF